MGSSDSFYFSQTNIRESSQVSVSNGGQSSSGNFGATSQGREESISAVLIPIPSSLLANLIPQTTSGTQNTRRSQQASSGSGNRITQRVQQTSSGSGAQNT